MDACTGVDVDVDVDVDADVDVDVDVDADSGDLLFFVLILFQQAVENLFARSFKISNIKLLNLSLFIRDLLISIPI